MKPSAQIGITSNISNRPLTEYFCNLCSVSFIAWAVLMAFAASGDTLPKKEPRLTEEQGKAQLEAFAKTWHTSAEWEARAKNIREGILREAHLIPLPTRCPLKP